VRPYILMKKLVVNADDFGRSTPINQGIIQAHQKGIVTSASLMTDREGFDEAVQLAKANPRLGIGLHLDLDSFFQVEHGVGRLIADGVAGWPGEHRRRAGPAHQPGQPGQPGRQSGRAVA